MLCVRRTCIQMYSVRAVVLVDHALSIIVYAFLYKYVYMCVCEREKEKEEKIDNSSLV